ncbi:Acidic endochitinase WIN6.2B [Zea mays]|uniref:chitinase n=1 Tax=Zea mays TaxID=4577 RepID=A0A3L6EDW5_MAIZE|nr:Acidic endochitinase WIN6.2B [Zea mays]
MAMTRALAMVAMLATAALFFMSARAQQCGMQAGGALCPDCLCCSQWGYCGSTPDYCTGGCQSQCIGSGCGGGGGGTPATPPSGPVSEIISESLFNEMLLHRNDVACPATGFYTYDAFIAAANAFPGFGTTGGADTQKRELAAFLAQTSHETTGGWDTAPDGPYTWGYCFKEEPPKPSCHDVITGQWAPSPADVAAGRLPGYGVLTNIINGGLECGHGADARVASRIGFYKRYCDMFGLSYTATTWTATTRAPSETQS